MDRQLVAAAAAGHLGGAVDVHGSGDRFTVESDRGQLIARVVDQGHGWHCGDSWRLVLLGTSAVDGPAPDWLALHVDGRWWPLASEVGFRSFVAAVAGDLSDAALAGILAANYSPMGPSRLIVDAGDLARTAAEAAGLVDGPVAPTRTGPEDGDELTFLSTALLRDAAGVHRLWIWRWHVLRGDLSWWAVPVIESELLDRYRP